MGRLTDAINVNNALGGQNLSDKGVVVAENATTYEIMNAIAEVSGGGVQYTSIEYNEDDTITLTDKDGIDHKMVCTYDDAGKLVGATYDGKAVELTYEGENLVVVGKTDIDLSGTKVRHEIEIFSAGNIVSSSMGTKTNDGMAIYGIGYYKAAVGNIFNSGYLISKDPDAVLTANITKTSQITYNDTIWYYGYRETTNDKSTYTDGVVSPYDAGKVDGTAAVKKILDYYFNIDGSIVPDFQNGFALGMASGGVVEVVDPTIETLIDNNGVLDSTEGTVEDKVEKLIDLAEKGENDTLKAMLLDTLTEFTITDEFSLENTRLHCASLEKFIAPNLIGKLAGYEFYLCTKIKYIDLGKITSISYTAITGCHRLETVILRNTDTIVTLPSAFTNNNSILRDDYTYFCYFYVPKALLENYKEATNWSNYANRFRAIEDYPEITGGVI